MARGLARPFGRADRYLLRLMAPRMGAALLVTLVALLVERLLRLFDILSSYGAEIGPVMGMLVNLVPHYLGLALPVAFSLGVLGAVGRLSRDNELDALESAGWSLRRIGASFILCGAGLAVVSLALFGFVQPYSRYAYYELRHEALAAGWNGRLEEGAHVPIGDGLLLSAGRVDPSGRGLRDIFVLRQEAKGDTAITARRGLLIPDPDSPVVELRLEDGRALGPEGEVLTFELLRLSRRIGPESPFFRPRGESERELTAPELWQAAYGDPESAAEPRFAAELHDRLVRAVSVVGVALISAPLAAARKRVSIWPRMALAVATLAVFDNLMKFAAGFAAQGRVAPEPALWGVALLFNGAGLWLYLSTSGQGTGGPAARLASGAADLAARARGLLRRRGRAR